MLIVMQYEQNNTGRLYVCDFLKGIVSFSNHFQVFLFHFFVEVGSKLFIIYL